MDKISYRNPSKSEVIGRCGGDEKREKPTTQLQVNIDHRHYWINKLKIHACDEAFLVIMLLVDSITKYILTRQFHVAAHLNNTVRHTYKSMSRD